MAQAVRFEVISRIGQSLEKPSLSSAYEPPHQAMGVRTV